jgi:hypothetical protein
VDIADPPVRIASKVDSPERLFEESMESGLKVVNPADRSAQVIPFQMVARGER